MDRRRKLSAHRIHQGPVRPLVSRRLPLHNPLGREERVGTVPLDQQGERAISPERCQHGRGLSAVQHRQSTVGQLDDALAPERLPVFSRHHMKPQIPEVSGEFRRDLIEADDERCAERSHPDREIAVCRGQSPERDQPSLPFGGPRVNLYVPGLEGRRASISIGAARQAAETPREAA